MTILPKVLRGGKSLRMELEEGLLDNYRKLQKAVLWNVFVSQHFNDGMVFSIYLALIL